jgi:hypothetical protein
MGSASSNKWEAEKDQPYTIKILIKNTGQTFAKNFVGLTAWALDYFLLPRISQ